MMKGYLRWLPCLLILLGGCAEKAIEPTADAKAQFEQPVTPTDGKGSQMGVATDGLNNTQDPKWQAGTKSGN